MGELVGELVGEEVAVEVEVAVEDAVLVGASPTMTLTTSTLEWP